MKTRALMALLLALVVAATVVAPSGAATGKKKSKSGPRVVGTDDEGDWGSNADPSLAPLGGGLGQDMIEAAIGMADKKTVNFIITVTSLPPWGGWPEISRYTWDFTVDGELRELDGKFTNYSRGACDPTSGQCPPPRDPGMGPFLVRGNCSVTGNVTLCEELGLVHAEFDPDKGTITIPVPVKLLGAKPGSEIVGVPNVFDGTISAAPSAFLTSGNFPMDLLNTTKTFVVPKG